jgi:hypothetical protein
VGYPFNDKDDVSIEEGVMYFIRFIAVIAFSIYFPLIAVAEDAIGGIIVGKMNSSGKVTYMRRVVVDSEKDKSFGWLLQLDTKKKTVKVRQILTCPDRPETWGKFETIGKLSTDGKTLTIEKMHEVSSKGNIWYSYGIAKGDAKGIYNLKITIDDLYTKSFDFVMK